MSIDVCRRRFSCHAISTDARLPRVARPPKGSARPLDPAFLPPLATQLPQDGVVRVPMMQAYEAQDCPPPKK